jgi:hypothetical protein
LTSSRNAFGDRLIMGIPELYIFNHGTLLYYIMNAYYSMSEWC